MKKALITVILFSIFSAFIGCEKKTTARFMDITEKEARLISHKTAGLINPDEIIAVRFQEDMVKAENIGISLKKEVFFFEPSIDGETKWQDTRTIVFTPNRPLKTRQAFSGYLDLAKLFPEKTNLEISQIPLNFATVGREIVSFEPEFVLEKEGDPTKLAFKAKISFNMKTTKKELSDAVKMFENDKKIDVAIQETDSANAFFIISRGIIRKDKDKTIKLVIEKEKLDLADNFIKEHYIPPLTEFGVSWMEKGADGEELFLQIAFSDELDPSKDYRGFIKTEPPVEISIKQNEKNAIIRGGFKHGERYKITVLKGMKSKWGTSLKENYDDEIVFPPLKPQILFSQKGVFLPSTNRKTIAFKTANLKKVILRVKKVYENNLGFFVQENKLESAKSRSRGFSGFRRVGVVAVTETLTIGDTKNKWLQSELDLRKVIVGLDKGLYIIELSYTSDFILDKPSREDSDEYDDEEWYYWGDWDDEYEDYRYYERGQVYKALILSDIGIIAKKTVTGITVFTTNLVNSEPLPGVKVALKSYHNQVIQEKQTDGAGKCVFDTTGGYYIEAESYGQRSVLLFNETELNTSLFDVGGSIEAAQELRAFIYTDRGVYRPGDSINLSAIVRNQENTFPENHPITLKLFNPRNRIIIDRTQRKSIDGFYNFAFATDDDAPTGNWRAELKIGDKTFSQIIKIETVVPFRIKVLSQSPQKMLTASDTSVSVDVTANYYFGNPAGGLDCEITYNINQRDKTFELFKGFIFSNEGMKFEPISSQKFALKLDENGKLSHTWSVPKIKTAPSAFSMDIDVRVLERGGRPVPSGVSIPFEPYQYYVGIKAPDDRFVKIGKDAGISAVVVSRDGKSANGRTLNWKVYRNRKYWWFDYEDRNDFKKRFKTDIQTEIVAQGKTISDKNPVPIPFSANDWGMLLVEIQDGGTGHTAGIFLNARSWGDEPSSDDADILSIRADKDEYSPGDIAKLIVQTPKKGNMLITYEKGDKLIGSRWIGLNSEETIIDVPITEEMMPTTYVFVEAIQPHAQTVNDRPIRMFGVVPIRVVDKKTRLELTLNAPAEIKPGESFTVSVKSKDSLQFQYTVAVVDEGLLDLTQFKTPNPWDYFFSKTSLLVRTYDIFSDVIGASWGEILKKFSVGGDFEARARRTPVKAKRFKPVSLFAGPLMSDEKGIGKVTFKMPQYVGSVRVMVVATKGNKYGNAEKAVPVKSPLMVLPTLPRFIGPGNKFKVPVTVFAMADGIGEVNVSIEVEGPLEIVGAKSNSIEFSGKSDKEVFFKVSAKKEIGVGKIKVTASSAKYKASETTEIAIQPASQQLFSSETRMLKSDVKESIRVPDDGLPGSNRAKLVITKLEKLEFSRRLSWLLHYPYGCIEQTISSVFPQLFFKDIVQTNKKNIEKIDANINAGIDRIRLFQTNEGGFSYWPNGSYTDAWSTNYAGHFLVEAKKLGYHVPDDLFKNWLAFQKKASRESSRESDLLERAYRCYVLSLTGEPPMGEMNLLREGSISEMDNTSKWLLAGAYKLAGAEGTAREIIKNATLDVDPYRETGTNFGSALRDQAIMLEILTLMNEKIRAFELFTELSEAISSKDWYSTQELGYALLAMGKFIKAYSNSGETISGEIILPNGKKENFSFTKASYSLDITEGFGKDVSVTMKTGTTAFATLEWEGIPLIDESPSEMKNFFLERRFLDEDGSPISIDNLKQGTVFWCHFTINNTSKKTLENVALTQLIPAGWEIENTRLTGEQAPRWASGMQLAQEEYLDIRDDRISWFFRLAERKEYDWRTDSYLLPKYDFLMKINAVTIGDFYLPPARAFTMYDDNYRATIAGKEVSVIGK